MNKVAIVTDSTANIPTNFTAGLDIHVVPLMLLWGDESFRDGVDITPTDFYKKLETTKIIPSTSQPSPAAFETVFNDLCDKGYDVLCILISSKLSGTVDSATQAKSHCTKGRIEVIDSLNTAMGLGFAVLQAARAASQGVSLDEIKKLTEASVPRLGDYFVVPTLEYLHRGGRIRGGREGLGACASSAARQPGRCASPRPGLESSPGARLDHPGAPGPSPGPRRSSPTPAGELPIRRPRTGRRGGPA